MEAVPADNVIHTRENGQPFHTGHILTYGGMRFCTACGYGEQPGDGCPAGHGHRFLPMTPPYTMTPAVVADGAMVFRPKILSPSHYGGTDTKELAARRTGSGTDVRVRAMK